jgi:hypothetical protein
MMINFSALPDKRPYSISNRRLFLYALIGILLFLAIELVAYYVTGNQSISGSPVFVVVILIGGLVYARRALMSFKLLISAQRASMQQFAHDNQWNYEGPKKANIQLLLPPHKYMAADSTRILFIVDGIHDEVPFKFYALQGFVKSLLSPEYTIGYETVLRISGSELSPTIQSLKPFLVESDDAYTYISAASNLLYRDDVLEIFRLADFV